MRAPILSVFLVLGSMLAAHAAPMPPAQPPYEVVRNHIDVEVNPDGSYLWATETAYRVLDAQGLRGLQQMTLSYTDGYQSLSVSSAYTLKADGRRIDVPASRILHGRGSSSKPGFEDIVTMTIVFPDVEIGDQVVLVSVLRQDVPWVKGQFASGIDLDRAIAMHDTAFSVTVPENYPLSVDAAGMGGGDHVTTGGKTHWSWTFNNDVAQAPEPASVADSDAGPHVYVSSFPDYASVAHAAASWFEGKAAVTPEIQSLADELTVAIPDRRDRARALYEWVSSHISYVQILLGAGGFVPHSAAEVLRNRYGDCKDHVMLLEALLAAKGIESSPALIAVSPTYRLPTAATPFAFNHVITYIPEFHLFADSTAQFAPFGVLPAADSGRSVVLTSLGSVAQTPSLSSADNKISVVEKIRISQDGTAEGDSRISSAGAVAVDLRGMLTSLSASSEPEYFHAVLGPGAEGTIDRGDTASLTPTYSYSSHYRESDVAAFPGPGALPPWLGYKPFYFTDYIAGAMPAQRTKPYACPSISAEEDVTIEFPPGVTITSMPKTEELRAPGVTLLVTSQKIKANAVHETTALHIDHPQAICTPEYYNSVHDGLKKMVAALKAQILYQ